MIACRLHGVNGDCWFGGAEQAAERQSSDYFASPSRQRPDGAPQLSPAEASRLLGISPSSASPLSVMGANSDPTNSRRRGSVPLQLCRI